MQHCLMEHRERMKDRNRQIYITDALKLIAENTARMAKGQVLTKRYIELSEPPKRKKEETAEDILQKVRDSMTRKR